MPNHCYQTVSLRGNIDVIHHLYDALQEGKRFCDVVLNCDRKHLGMALGAIISRLHDELEEV